MAFLDNIVSALREWSVWKRIEEAPNRIDELEKRVAELEDKLRRAPGEACPKCGEYELRTTKSVPDKRFGDMGGIRHYYACNSCDYTTEKLETPK